MELPEQPGSELIIIFHYLTHLLLLGYIPKVVTSISNSASCIKGLNLPREGKWNKHIHETFVYARADNSNQPSSRSFDKFAIVCFKFLCKNNGSNYNSQAKVPQMLQTLMKSAAGSIWKPPLTQGRNRHKLHTQTLNFIFKTVHFKQLLPDDIFFLFALEIEIAFFNKSFGYSSVLLEPSGLDAKKIWRILICLVLLLLIAWEYR